MKGMWHRYLALWKSIMNYMIHGIFLFETAKIFIND